MHTLHTLDNGLRVMHIQRQMPIAYVGVAIDVGTRDEVEDESGMAHFAEHTIFKGTDSRRAWQIITRLENVGGQVDAYTTKEDTYVYSVVPTAYISRAVDLISDIVLHPTFPAQELEKERIVVLDEIDSYRDTPSELIFDEFEERLFPNDSIGRNILGCEQSLSTFDTERMRGFVRRCYTPDRLLLFCMGDISERALLKLAERCFVTDGGLSDGVCGVQRRALTPLAAPFDVKVKMDTNQVHCVLGCRVSPLDERRRYAAILLNNILGGPNMSSLLNMAIRERHGYCYTIDSSFAWYTDTAVWTLYFGCDPENYKSAFQLVRRTLDGLMEREITPRQLAVAKRQLRGQVLIGNQNLESMVLAVSKKVLHGEKVRDSEEVLRDIEGLSAGDLREVAQVLFDDLSVLTYME